MSFTLRWSPQARDNLTFLATHHRVAAIDGEEEQLKDQPTQPTRNRKQLRENPLATWELRLGDLRIFYNVNDSDQAVEIVAVGIKEHNRLIIGGAEVNL